VNYIDELSKVSVQRLLMGDFNAPLSETEQRCEDAAQQYFTLCDAGWDYRKARQYVCNYYVLRESELHKAIQAYNKRHP